MRILVLENDPLVVSFLRHALRDERHIITAVSDPDSAFDYLIEDEYDLAILDMMLSEAGNISLVTEARKEGLSTPILMLTKHRSVDARVHGLDHGADDCMSAPLHENELRARVCALTRRHKRLPETFVEIDQVRIDLMGRVVRIGTIEIGLAETEFRILSYLMRNAGQVISRCQILDHVWGTEFQRTPNLVDVYIRQIRLKLQSAGVDNFISTVWGTGWRISRHDRGQSVA